MFLIMKGAGEVLRDESQTIPKQPVKAEVHAPKGAADYCEYHQLNWSDKPFFKLEFEDAISDQP